MDTVLPRVSSAVGRPVCVCETYLHPLHRENVYSLRLASRHWPRHHHSGPAANMHAADGSRHRGRRARLPRKRTPLASPPRSDSAGSWSGRCAAAAERNGELSYLARDRGEARKRPNETRSPDVCARKNFAHLTS